MTPKRKRVLEMLRAGKWETLPQLTKLLRCTHTETRRVVRDLEAMGKIQEVQVNGVPLLKEDGKTRCYRATV